MPGQANAEKKKRQALERKMREGKEVVSDAEYFQQKTATVSRTLVRRLQNISNISTPNDVSWVAFSIAHPDLAQKLQNGIPIAISKKLPQDAVRSLWYFQLDSHYTFNACDNKIAAANCALVELAWQHNLIDAVQPRLLIPYAIACNEYRIIHGRYLDQDNFIKLWHSLPESQDLRAFSRLQSENFNKAAKDLKKALKESLKESGLDDIFADKRFTDMATDMKESLALAVKEEGQDELDGWAEDELVGKAQTEDPSAQGTEMHYYTWDVSRSTTGNSEQEDRMLHGGWVDLVIEALGIEVQQIIDAAPAIDIARASRVLHTLCGMMCDKTLRQKAKEMGFTSFE